jgi:hypothetical protein
MEIIRTSAYAAARTVYLLVAYAKVDKEDLTADEKRLFRTLIEGLNHD